jgi:DNA-binding beta-propeller fold protein YncE
VGGSNVLAVLDVSGCTATRTSTCRHPAPSVQDPEFEVALDPGTDTLYASNLNLPQIDVIDAASCHAGDLGGCRPVATIPVQDPQDRVGAIDGANHTLYVADPQAGKIALIDTATCNAYDTAGCATKPATITVGSGASATALNLATQSLYTVIGMNGNQVAVISAATCNAQVTSGCRQPIGVVRVGAATGQLAVSQASDTIYAPSIAAKATIPAGRAAQRVAIDAATDQIYVTNWASATVSIINGASCNATVTTGCSKPAAAQPVGSQPHGLAINPATDTVYALNRLGSGSTSIFAGTP